jgi:hypothetical protein
VSAEIFDWFAEYRRRRGHVPMNLPDSDYLKYWGEIAAATIKGAMDAELARLGRPPSPPDYPWRGGLPPSREDEVVYMASLLGEAQGGD